MDQEIILFLKKYQRHFSFVLLAAGCILLIYFNASRYGIGVSADAAHYTSISKNILKDFSFYSSITEWDYNGSRNWNGFWPQLFPILLTIPVLLSSFFSSDIPIIIFNGFFLALTVALSYLLLKRFINGKKPELIATIVLVVFSKWLLWTFLYIWTEAVFIPFVILYFLVFDDFIKDKSDKNFNRLLLITVLLSITRYIGVVFFLPLFIFSIYTRFIFNPKRIFYFLLSGIPFCSNIFLNYLFTNYLLGVRPPSETSYLSLFTRMIQGITLWLFGIRLGLLTEIIIALVVVSAGCFIFYRLWKYSTTLSRIVISSCILFLIMTIVFIASAKVEKISFRYISPVFIPISLLMLSWLLNLKYKNISKTIVLILLISSVFITSRFSIQNHSKGIGVFSTMPWRNSATINFLREKGIRNSIYSNYPDAINYLTSFPAKMITDREDKIDRMISVIKNRDGILVLFNIPTRKNPVDLDLLQSRLNNVKKENLADGVIYYFQ